MKKKPKNKWIAERKKTGYGRRLECNSYWIRKKYAMPVAID